MMEKRVPSKFKPLYTHLQNTSETMYFMVVVVAGSLGKLRTSCLSKEREKSTAFFAVVRFKSQSRNLCINFYQIESKHWDLVVFIKSQTQRFVAPMGQSFSFPDCLATLSSRSSLLRVQQSHGLRKHRLSALSRCPFWYQLLFALKSQ